MSNSVKDCIQTKEDENRESTGVSCHREVTGDFSRAVSLVCLKVSFNVVFIKFSMFSSMKEYLCLFIWGKKLFPITIFSVFQSSVAIETSQFGGLQHNYYTISVYHNQKKYIYLFIFTNAILLFRMKSVMSNQNVGI